MSSSIWTRIAITALAGCMVGVLVAPAWGQGGDLTLRRDGSKAVPFVADLDPKPATAGGGFDWGDAAIGAGFGAAAVALAVAVAMRGRRPVRGHRRVQQA